MLIGRFLASKNSEKQWFLNDCFRGISNIEGGLCDGGCLTSVQCPATGTESFISVPSVESTFTPVDNTVHVLEIV